MTDSSRSAMYEIWKVMVLSRLFSTIINSLIIFLAFTLFLITINMSWLYALIPTLLYMIPSSIKSIYRTRYKDIEETIPDLEWQLRTVADNMHKDNEMVKSLKKNVLKKIKGVRSSYFFNNKVTLYKFLGIFCLSFLIVAFASFQIEFVDLKSRLPAGFASKINKFVDDIDFTGEFEKKTGRNIYGRESVIELGNEELNIEIKPDGSKVDISKIEDVEDTNFEKAGVIKDIGAAADASYGGDKFKKEESELIKAYLKKLAEYSNKDKQKS